MNMPNLNNKIWITAITLLAMLLTSFVVSTQASGDTLLSTLSQEHITELHHPLDSEPNCTEIQHNSNVDSNHHCCNSICLLKIPTYKSFADLALQSHSLALIQRDGIKRAIIRAQMLYRPPIS